MISAEALWSRIRDPLAKTLQLQSSHETDRRIAISPWGLIAQKSARHFVLLPNLLREYCERRLVVYEQLVDLDIALDRDLHQC
jgi:hypothetical protein